MNVLSVGELYIPGKTSWPERVEYNYYAGGHELRFFLRDISLSEEMDIRKTVSKFGLLVEQSVIFLIYKIGKLDGDAPYSWHMVPENTKPKSGIPSEKEMVLLHIQLIEASTGSMMSDTNIDFIRRDLVNLLPALPAPAVFSQYQLQLTIRTLWDYEHLEGGGRGVSHFEPSHSRPLNEVLEMQI